MNNMASNPTDELDRVLHNLTINNRMDTPDVKRNITEAKQAINTLFKKRMLALLPDEMGAPYFGADNESDISAGFRKGWNSAIADIKNRLEDE